MLNSPRVGHSNIIKKEQGRVLDPVCGNSIAKLAKQSPAVVEAIFVCSPFLRKALLTEAPYVAAALENKQDYPLPPSKKNRTKQQLMADLRQTRLRLALLVGWRELAGASLEETTQALSRFADEAVSQTVDFLLGQHLPNAATRPYAVFAMGKLGANELNYSSDIDLMAFYDGNFDSKTATRIFPLITSDMLTILSARTPQGYVFRTDLRLRPDPFSMPLAISLNAAEVYYETVGQNWERAALIKARHIGGDAKTGNAFLKLIEPFVWRRSLDFAAIDDILSIRRQSISASFKAKDTLNIKLDSGGIRDIEFFVQTRQLIWGGRNKQLRIASTLKALGMLYHAEQLTQSHLEQLSSNYRFLRHVENRLQMIQDHQTHSIPAAQEAKHNLAIFCGFRDVADFKKALSKVISTTLEILDGFYRPPKPLGGEGRLSFTATEPDPQTLATLSKMGFEHPTEAWHMVSGWHFGRSRAMRSERARQLLTELTPSLLGAFSQSPSPQKALEGFNQFLAEIPASVAIFSLLAANPNIMKLLAEVLGSAPRQAKRLTRNPAMLESLLRAEFYLPINSKHELMAEIEEELTATNVEPQIIIRRWAKDKKFQLAVQLLTNQNDAWNASSHYTQLAEVILAKEFEMVKREFENSYEKSLGKGEMAIVALGKFGACHLSGASDLDLIFIYKDDPDQKKKPLQNPSLYFNRLAQRVESGLVAKTSEGELYTVDTRLRPSGANGSAATSLKGFMAYHETTAEFWERMALHKARVVLASPKFKAEIDQAIKTILAKKETELNQKLSNLRRRIHKEHPQNLWNIKYIEGGLLDLDLLIQFLQRGDTKLAEIRPLKALGLLVKHNKIIPSEGKALMEGYKLWFNLDGLKRLCVKDNVAASNFGASLQQKLVATAKAKNFEQLESLMETTRTKLADIIKRYIG